jgi:ankyrin repeat protein
MKKQMKFLFIFWSLFFFYYTPLIIASWFGSVDLVHFLIKSGADVSLTDNYQCTALHRACQSTSTYVVSCLLENGANPNIPNHQGYPLHISSISGDVDTIITLVNHGAIVSTVFNHLSALNAAVLNFRLESIRILLQFGASIEEKDSKGNTPLHSAVLLTQEKIVRLLVINGANVNSTNNLQESPLHYAAESGSVNIFLFLLDSGADPTATNCTGLNPIEWAISSKQPSIVEAFENYKKCHSKSNL